MIRLQCACGRKIAAPDQWLGKRVKCPQCGQPVMVTQPDAAPAAPAAAPAPVVAARVAPQAASSRPRASKAVVAERPAPPRTPSRPEFEREEPIHAKAQAAIHAEEPPVKVEEPPQLENEFSPPLSSPFNADMFAADSPASHAEYEGESHQEDAGFSFDAAETAPDSAPHFGEAEVSPSAHESAPPTDSAEDDQFGHEASEPESAFAHESTIAEDSAVGEESAFAAEPAVAHESIIAPAPEAAPAAAESTVQSESVIPTGARRRSRPVPVDPGKLQSDEDDFETRRARLPFWLGIFGILVGLTGAAALWLPQYAIFGIPIAGLGVALGAIGVAVSMSRYRIGLVAPLIATIISLIALALPFALPKLNAQATVAGRSAARLAQVEQERAAAEAKRRGVLDVRSLELVSPDADTQTPDLKYTLVNKSGKTIQGFNGSIQLYDQEHNPLGGLQLELAGPFAPGAPIKGQNVWTLDPQVQKQIADHKTTAEYRADWVRFDGGKLETFEQ